MSSPALPIILGSESADFSSIISRSPVITTEKLSGSANYLSWAASVESWFIGQGFEDHLTKNAEDVPHRAAWKEADALLLNLLWQSIDRKLCSIYTPYRTCSLLWAKAKTLYANDIRRLYTVLSDMFSGAMDISDFIGMLESQKEEFKSVLPVNTIAEDTSSFWTKLLDGKHPYWKILYGSTIPRNRKRVRLNDSLPKKPELVGNELDKKRKKCENDNTVRSSGKPGAEAKRFAGNKEGTLRSLSASPVKDSSALHQGKMVDSNEKGKLCDKPECLHLLLKSEISALCDLLNLSENLKLKVEIFLEYVINYHHVNSESATILQALQLALCWTAASWLKIKIDHKGSLELAKLYLNYECKKEEIDHVYSMLHGLKEMFLQHIGDLETVDSWKLGEMCNAVVEMDRPCEKSSKTTMPCLQNVQIVAEDCDIQGTSCDEVISCPKSMDEFGLTLRNVSWSGRESQTQKQLERLLQEEVGKVNVIYGEYAEKKALLEEYHKTEAAVVRYLYTGSATADKLKILDKEYSRKIKACEDAMNIRLRELGVAHLVSRGEVQQESCSKLPDGLPNKLPEVQQRQDFPHAYNHMENFSSPDQSTNAVSHSLENCNVEISNTQEVVPDDESAAFEGNGERACALVETNVENDELINLALGGGVSTEVAVSTPPEEKIPGKAMSTVADEEVLPENTSCILEKSISINPLETTTLLRASLSDGEVPANVNTDVYLITADAPENLDPVIACSCEAQGHVATMVHVSDEPAMVEAQDYVHLTQCLENVDVSDPHLSVKEVHNGSVSGVVENDRPGDGSDVVALVNQASSGMPNGKEQVGPPDRVLDKAEIMPTNTETGMDRHVAVTHRDSDSQGPPLADSASMQPSNVFAEAACMPSYRALANQELRGGSNATSTSMPERNEVEEEQHDASQQFETLWQHIHDLPSVNETERQPPGEGETVNLIVQTPSTIGDENLATHQNQAGSESAVNIPGGMTVTETSANLTTPTVLEPSTQPFRSLLPLASMILQQLLPDPLQNELERIQREMDQTTKAHEEKKVRLQSDCNKEIEEIRKKYDLKLKEVEVEYLQKRKELELNHNNVLMNKILAETFRSNCVDLKTSGTQGFNGDVISRFEQQLLPLAAQQNGLRPSQVPGPSTVLQTSSVLSFATPSLSSQTTFHTVASFQNVRPAAMSVHDSSAVFCGVTSRAPEIGHTMPLPGSVQVPSKVHGPAPHLQAFRPSVASLVPPHNMPNQPPPTNSPLVPAYVPPVPSQAAPSVGPAGPCTGAHSGEFTGGLAHPGYSWAGLYMDISRYPNAFQVINLASGER